VLSVGSSCVPSVCSLESPCVMLLVALHRELKDGEEARERNFIVARSREGRGGGGITSHPALQI
jgi:hypothetical protein